MYYGKRKTANSNIVLSFYSLWSFRHSYCSFLAIMVQTKWIHPSQQSILMDNTWENPKQSWREKAEESLFH